MTIPTERQLRLARYHWQQARIETIESAIRCGALVPCDPMSGSYFRWATAADRPADHCPICEQIHGQMAPGTLTCPEHGHELQEYTPGAFHCPARSCGHTEVTA